MKDAWKHKLKPIAWYVFLVMLGLEIYLEASQLWNYDHKGGHQYIWVTEFILLLPWAFLFYRKEHPWRSLVDFLIFIIPLYLAFDLFYLAFIRVPTPDDVMNVSALYKAMPVLTIVAGVITMVWLVYVTFRIIKGFEKWKVILLPLIPLAAGLSLYDYDHVFWKKSMDWVKNGRITNTLYENMYAYKFRKRLEKVDLAKCERFFAPIQLNHKPNITVVVLESWAPAEAFSAVPYDFKTLAPSLARLLDNQHGQFSWLMVPTYGGGTARSEFEALSGYSDPKDYHAVVFNDLQGAPIDSFVWMLRNNGYQVKGYVATEHGIFNSMLAYPSVGLENITYLKEDKDFLSNWYTKGDKHIFDGDLFRYFLSQYTADSNRPQFNYLLGMYGHIPFHRNKAVRPDKIEHKDPWLKKWLNTYYYRNEALAEFFDKYIEKHPDDILFVVGDHLPPYVVSETNRYEKESVYVQHALFYNQGHWEVLPEKMPLYGVPRYITNILSDASLQYDESEKERLQQTLCRIKESTLGQ